MDFIKDESGRQLLRLQKKMDLPEHAKQARLDYESVAELPDASFANPLKREFPVDEPGHTFWSYAYAKMAGIKEPWILATIEKAGSLQGISEDFKRVDAALFTKEASSVPEPIYALQLDFGPAVKEASTRREREGGTQGFYPITTALDVEESARRLGNDFPKLPRDLFTKAAQELTKAARTFQLPVGQVPKVVWQYGEPRMPDWELVAFQAQKRATYTKDPFYEELAASAQEHWEEGEGEKYASLWHQADVLNNLPVERGEFMDAFQIFNSGVTKSAWERELDDWVLLRNVPVPKSAVAAIKEADVRKRTSPEIGEQLMTMVKAAQAGTFFTVPAPMEPLLLELAAATP